MTRWPICACAAGTPGPIAATMPQGSCPAMVGSDGAASPPVAPPAFGRRYWCRSLPHMPEAFISMTTSPSPGVGSGKFISSSWRSPVNTTPRILSSWPDLSLVIPLPSMLACAVSRRQAIGGGRMRRARLSRPVAAIAAAFVALLLPVRASLAWGPEAHRTIALIADQALRKSDPAVHAKVLALLATDKGDALTKNDI